MTRDELLRRLRDHEDGFVERKSESAANTAEIRKTAVAFANSVTDGKEAIFFIGIRDDGRVEGCADTDSKQKAVRKVCEQDCYPPIRFQSEVLSTEGGDVVAIIIPESDNRPHFSGPAYVRRGSESISASTEVFDQLVHSRNSKVAAISKLRDQVVSVVSLQHKLGEVRHMDGGGYRETTECRIIGCDAHTIRMQIISLGKMISEPLDHIRVTRDEEKHRPMLVVTGY